jgi:hypothetical protein
MDAGYNDFISFCEAKTYSSKMAWMPDCARRAAPWMAL